MTRADHSTGTDRVAEVAARLPDAGIVVNLQGDEPEISGAALDLVVSLLENDPDAPMATLATPIRAEAVYRDPSCVKVVATRTGRALYFSRSPIPCYRDGPARRRPDPGDPSPRPLRLSPRLPPRLATLPPSPLEAAEKLEQLRVLEAGLPDRRRVRRRAEHRDRHARGLPPVRRALAETGGRGPRRYGSLSDCSGVWSGFASESTAARLSSFLILAGAVAVSAAQTVDPLKNPSYPQRVHIHERRNGRGSSSNARRGSPAPRRS